MPTNPVFLSPSSASCGKRSSRSLRSASGVTTSATHSRTASCTARWSSLRTRSTQPPSTRSRSRPAWAARSAARCSSYVRPLAPRSSALVARTAPAGDASRAAARSRVAASSSSTGTTMVASPIAAASAAPHPATGGADLEGAGVAHQVDQRLGAAEVGDQPEGRLLHRQLGVVGEHPQVAGQRQLEAGADRVALHRGDADDPVVAPPRERLLEAVDDRVQRPRRPWRPARPGRARRRRRW